MSRKRRPYTSLQDWMERTGKNQDELAQLTGIGRSFISKILTGGRMCSMQNALKLHRVTGVPIERMWKYGEKHDATEQTDTTPQVVITE